jgi:hypothetical protein
VVLLEVERAHVKLAVDDVTPARDADGAVGNGPGRSRRAGAVAMVMPEILSNVGRWSPVASPA